MANYTIIGGDGKEYGPITSQDVHQWISEGRLAPQSLAKGEGDAEFRALEKFPEFADALAPKISASAPQTITPVSAPNATFEAALSRVKSAAVGLQVTAILNLILGVWNLVWLMFAHPNMEQLNSALQQMNNPQMEQFMQKLYHFAYGPLGIVNDIFTLAMSALILMGALKMKALRSYEFAYTASILAMIPCLTPCCILGLPFGIWALVVLNKADVKSHFS